jgi:hypothetical protein
MVVLHYGSERWALLRTMYTWLNLTILLTFGWPVLVSFFNAPAGTPDETPFSWFLPRLLIPVATGLLVARFWRTSHVPAGVARPEAALRLFTAGQIWPQVVLFLTGVLVALTIYMLVVDPAAGLKVLLLGLAETLVVQMLIAGLVKCTYEVLDAEPVRTFLICTGLFALTFAARSGIAAAQQSAPGEVSIMAAILAGLVAGGLIGAVTLFLRDRSGSLYPGVVAQLLVAGIIPVFFD